MKEKTFHLVRAFSLTVCQAAAVSLCGWFYSSQTLPFYFIF